MPKLHYHLLDVFTNQPFGGNPLAVFTDSGDTPTALMQSIANELNLSETVFIQPSDQYDFRLRIFTPKVELPMAGHPTVGTGFLLKYLGLADGTIICEEGVGPVPVTIAESVVWMQQPLPEFGDIERDRADVAAMLSLSEDSLHLDLPIQTVSCGVPFLYVPLKDLTALSQARLRLDLWEQTFPTCSLFVFTPNTDDATVRSRMFAPAMGIAEDPATGAASGPLGAYLVEHGVVSRSADIISRQGVEMGRPSEIHIRIEKTADRYTKVLIGGTSCYMGEGTLTLTDRR